MVMNEGKAMDAALDRISQLMVENESLREFIATMTLEGEQPNTSRHSG